MCEELLDRIRERTNSVEGEVYLLIKSNRQRPCLNLWRSAHLKSGANALIGPSSKIVWY